MATYNLRVYAIILNDRNEVLLSDERRFGKSFTKFPGGGLEWGEGLADCIERELLEETGVTMKAGELFYVNDHFQQAAFRENDQLISFYFNIQPFDFSLIKTTKLSPPMMEEGERFRWRDLSTINEAEFTFPIDQLVAKKLRELQSK